MQDIPAEKACWPTGNTVALGVFDGLHLGHQALLARAREIKENTGFPVLVMTFHPHPRTLTGHPNGYDRSLTPAAEKTHLAEDLGADYFLSVAFTRELAATLPLDFVHRYLVSGVSAGHVVCGFNFTFGHRGQGTPSDLERWGLSGGFDVTVVPPFEVGGDTVSSTRIRNALKAGDVTEAAACLGRPYCLYGRVAHGDGRGHRIGVPTSNVAVPSDKVVPGKGVYAALARVPGEHGPLSFPSLVNVGTRPTFGGEGVRVECHIPGFDGILYDRAMQVFFLERVRDERRFPDASSLRAQVRDDVEFLRSGFAPDGAWRKAGSFTLPRGYDRMLQADLP